jgi:NADPH:quinone reductase-like Zn-dependent oxidoreductase
LKAIVVDHPGPPEVLQICDLPRPEPRPGWVLIRVKAFGLNRSEMFTRQGHSGAKVVFPRVLGIECVGIVEEALGSDLAPGQTVAAVMGGLGRTYDGGYAEFTLVPRSQVLPLDADLAWETLAAIPETYLTAWGGLFEALDVQAGGTLLIRGGTSALGLASLALAKDRGLTVLATTRSAAKAETLKARGADGVILDTGEIASEVRRLVPGGVPYLLELIGARTLLDSLQAAAPQGIVCNSGILGNSWTLERFEPLAQIPSTVRLTVYDSETLTAEKATGALQTIVDGVAAGRFRVDVDRVFAFEEIVEAHRTMEENRAQGKLVVRVG